MVSLSSRKVGVLALQGNFEQHIERISNLGAQATLIKYPDELDTVSHFILPGGESTALLKLLSEELKEKIIQKISSGTPTLATCAGLILLAKKVSSPSQESLEILDIEVQRNSYGRQIDSSIENLSWTSEASQFDFKISERLEGVFIRAPKILSYSDKVIPILKRGSEAVLIKQDNILAASFHPELSESSKCIHQSFLLS